ncbi:uncharacterized protein LOC131951610, partial [Physella acuta]|uniref:uncharacterized protein LOC131951610 n=1 Tax=Physella acuta TaxID=109671 RepID=UPI0027DAC245
MNTRSRVFDLTLDHANEITWIRIVTRTPGHEHALTAMFKGVSDYNFNIQCKDPVEYINQTTTDIICRNQQVVRGVRIQFKADTTLCSIYVSGGRNVALKQNATQSSDYDIYYASKAVDGNTDS